MSDYSVEIKIAGQLASSFKSSIQDAKNSLLELSKAAKTCGTDIKAVAKDIGAYSTDIKTAAKNINKGNAIVNTTARDVDVGTASITEFGNSTTAAGKKFGIFKSVIYGAKGSILGLAKAAGKIGSATIKATAKGIGMATAATGGLAAAAVNVGREFETAMSQVAATKLLDTTTKSGKRQFKELEEAARQCGATTAFSATEAAESLNNLSMAGYSTKKAIAALPTTLNLAGAGSLELAQSASILTAGMASLGIDKTEEGFKHFADILAVTASKAKTDIAGIGEAITTVGKTAANLKGGTEEVAASLGILADVDLVGAEGGTHLRNMIMSLQNPRNKKAGELFSKLKLDAYDSQGKMRGLNEIFKDLSKSMSGMTDKQKNGIISTIFKQTDVAAASAMIENCGDRFDELYEAAAKSSKGTGAAAKMYAKQMDNLQGDIDILKSSLSDLGISFYKDTGGPIREVTQAASEMVTQLNKAYKSGGLSAMAAEIGNCMGQVVNGIAQYAPLAVDTGIEFIQNLVNGITQNSSGIAIATGNVLTAFVGGLSRLVPQIALTGVDIVLQLAQSFTAQTPQLVTSGVQAITGLIDGLMGWGPEIENIALGLIQSLTTSIIANAPTLLQSAVQLISGLFSGMTQMFPQLSTIAIQLINSLAHGIQTNLPQMIQAAMQALMSFSGSLRENAGSLVDAGLSLIMTLAQSLISSIPVFIQTVPTIITNIAGIINDNAPKLLSAGIQLAIQFLSGIIQAVPTIISNIPQIIQAIVSVFTAFNWMSLGSQVVTFIGNGISTAITSIPQIFSNFIQTVQSIVTSFGWQSLGRGIIQTIANGIRSMITSIPQIFMNIGQFAVQAITSINWWNVGITIIQLIGTAISGAGGFIIDAITEIGGSIIDGIYGIFGGGDEDVSSSGAEAAKSYASGIESNSAEISNAAASLSNTTFSNMDLSGATAAGTQTGDAFNAGVTSSLGSGLDMTSIMPSVVNESEIAGLYVAPMAQAMTSAGTESASAFNTSFSESLSTVDTSAFTSGIEIAGTEGAAAITSGFTAGSTEMTTAVSTLGTQINTSFETTWQMTNTSTQTAMQTMYQTVSTQTKQIVSAIQSMSQSAVNIVRQMGSSIQSILNNINLLSAGTNMMQGLVNGINSMQSQVETAAKNVAQAAATSVNNALQIHSPSRLMIKSGQYVDEGLAGGIKDNSGSVKAAAQAALVKPVIDTSMGLKSVTSTEIGMRGSRVHDALDWITTASTTNNSMVNNQSESSPTFVFSPTYNIQGDSNKSDLSDITNKSYEEFKKLANRFIREQRKKLFA